MKKAGILTGLLFTFFIVNAQVGIGTITPDESSVLDISASDKGILIPQVSLSDVSDTMLDGVNIAATGLLIWNTNASVIGGNGVGFYYFNGTNWERLSTTAGDDIDWYKTGTTTAPTTINDSIFTLGNVTIGDTTTPYKLGLKETNDTINRVLNIQSDNATITKSSSIHNEVNYTGTDSLQANYNYINDSGTGVTIGSMNEIEGSGFGSEIGLFNKLYGSSITNKYGVYNDMKSVSTATKYGMYNNFSSSSGSVYGLYNGINHFGFGSPTGVYNSIVTDDHTSGVRNYIAQYGQFKEASGVNNFIDGSNGSWLFGVQNVFENDGDGQLVGTYNSIHSEADGTGGKYGVYNNFQSLSRGIHYGMYSNFDGNGTDTQYGIYSEFDSAGSGTKYGIYTNMTNSAGGTHYGSFTTLDSSGSGNKYGSYIDIDSGAGGTHYGIYSNVQKSGSYAGYYIGELLGTARLELTTDNDATATAGSGVIEIADALRIDANEIITNTNTPLYLQHNNGGDLIVDNGTFAVDASANRVGIGTTSPGRALDVTSRIRVRNGANTAGIWYADGANDRQFAGVQTHSLTGTSQKWGVYNNGNWRFIVQGNGRVGIGTTAPGFALDVVGDINTSGNIRQSGGAYDFPDYVFESYFDGYSEHNPVYTLRTLSEIETFIMLNKHLPGVQNRADVLRNGWNVTEGVRDNLEKVEELYLYAIEADKKISTLYEENRSLKMQLKNQQREIDAIKALISKQ